MTTTSKQTRKPRPDPEQVVSSAVKRLLNCSHNGHDWQPTLIKGLIICTHCHKIAGCRTCAPQTAKPDTWGLCRMHQGSQSADKQEARV